MKKKQTERSVQSKDKYLKPEVEVFCLGQNLNLLKQSFSMEAGFNDWNGDDTLLDNDLDDSSQGSDFTNGGLLGNN